MAWPDGVIERAGLAEAVWQATDGIVITDADGIIQLVNPAFSSMTGFENQEAVGKTPRVLKSGKQGPSFYQELWRTIRSGRTWQGELINRRRDGRLYTEEMRITPIRNAGGAITNYIAFKRDITARRASEELRRFLPRSLKAPRMPLLLSTPKGQSWFGAGARSWFSDIQPKR